VEEDQPGTKGVDTEVVKRKGKDPKEKVRKDNSLHVDLIQASYTEIEKESVYRDPQKTGEEKKSARGRGKEENPSSERVR